MMGANFFFEWICVYGVLTYFAIRNSIRSYKASLEAKRQQQKQNQKVEIIFNGIDEIKERLYLLEELQRESGA